MQARNTNENIYTEYIVASRPGDWFDISNENMHTILLFRLFSRRCITVLSGFHWPNLQISLCTCPISHNAPSRTEMCIFLLWVEHCGIWDRYIVRHVRLVYWFYIDGLVHWSYVFIVLIHRYYLFTWVNGYVSNHNKQNKTWNVCIIVDIQCISLGKEDHQGPDSI